MSFYVCKKCGRQFMQNFADCPDCGASEGMTEIDKSKDVKIKIPKTVVKDKPVKKEIIKKRMAKKRKR